MNEENPFADLYAALAKAQGQFGPIVKNREVSIKSDKGNYRFRYADLEELIAKTRPALAANGLAVMQSTGCMPDGMSYIETELTHANGGRVSSRLPIIPFKGSDDPKRFGAAMTYLRRYMYGSLLCLAADDDLDEDGRHDEPEQNRTFERVEEPSPGPKKAEGKADTTPASAGEIKWVETKLKGREDYAEVLKRHGIKSLESLTKAEFKAIREALK